MSVDGLRVFEDPAHPEGGHVLILFEGVTTPPKDARFQVEALEDGAQTWPEHLLEPMSVVVTERGLEIAAGPEIGNAVLEGTPVTVAVPAAGIHGEILWPSITPLVFGRVLRGGVQAAARRRVVVPEAQASRLPSDEMPVPKKPPAPVGNEPKATPPQPQVPKPTITKEVAVVPPAATKPAANDNPPLPDEKPSPSARRVALVAAAAFVAGIGSVLAYAAVSGPWPFGQSAPKPVATAPTPVPSLYDALVLPAASPRGLRAGGKADSFTQVKAAWGGGARPQDGAEAAYWLRAIARDSMPDNLAKSFSALGYLALEGDGIARDPALATMFFEIAAIAGRCDAFAALADKIEPVDKWRTIRWQGIAEQKKCPEPKKR